MIWPSAQSIVCRSVLRSQQFTSGVRAGFQRVNQYITYEFVIQNWKGYARGSSEFSYDHDATRGHKFLLLRLVLFSAWHPTKGQNLSQRRNGWFPEIKDF